MCYTIIENSCLNLLFSINYFYYKSLKMACIIDFYKSIAKVKFKIVIVYFLNGGSAVMITNFAINNNKIIIKNNRRIL